MLFPLLACAAISVKFADPVVIDDAEPVVGTIGDRGFELKGRGFPQENSDFNRELELKGIDPNRCKCYPCSVPSDDVARARNEGDRYEVERALLERKLAKQRAKIAQLERALN